jgi:hypothetical protein
VVHNRRSSTEKEQTEETPTVLPSGLDGRTDGRENHLAKRRSWKKACEERFYAHFGRREFLILTFSKEVELESGMRDYLQLCEENSPEVVINVLGHWLSGRVEGINGLKKPLLKFLEEFEAYREEYLRFVEEYEREEREELAATR